MDSVTFYQKDDTLYLALSGRIDAANAQSVYDAMVSAREQSAAEKLVVDAKELEYISSAGLRVLLKLRKSEPTLRVINVCSDVNEILEMTGFTEIIPVEKAMRELSVDGCEIIGQGAKGTVYRYDPETVLKVYHDPDCLPEIRAERELARKAFVLGVPTAISFDVVRVGECYGTMFELIDARSLSQIMTEQPGEMERNVKDFADILRGIHAVETDDASLPEARDLALRWVAMAKNFLPAATAAALEELVREAPVCSGLIHGDYHSNNLLVQNGEILLIDMATLSRGLPVFELANICYAYETLAEVDPENVAAFLDMPQALYSQVWGLFLPRYLGTEEEEKIRAADRTSRLMAYTRLLYHFGRRGGESTETGRRAIALGREKIPALLAQTKTLVI